MRLFFLLSTLLLSSFNTHAQTIGLFDYDAASWEGYTLFSPNASENTYLIDNCGREINTWASAYQPGNSIYLLPDGNLLRTGRTSSTVFSGGGIGGHLEILDWTGSIIWQYDYSSMTYHHHHDVFPMSNGNILVLAWERKTPVEVTAAGRDPGLSSAGAVWPEHIVELQPVGSSSALTVWEWHLWDHLVQDFDSTKANYGVVADHPELVNLNFSDMTTVQPDWIHANAIFLNEDLDQIVISAHHFSEIWVIDHSTSTAQAAGHTGGTYGKGGDLLYRWGNPEAYDHGSDADQTLWKQHSAHWIPDSLPGGGKIMIFNNGQGRPAGNYSSVDVIVPPQTSPGVYSYTPGVPYGPTALDWTYASPADFYSAFISGAHRLPNGNTLICEGGSGEFFEVDSTGVTVWKYVNPVNASGPMTQGDTPMNNSVFRCTRYDASYSAFAGKDMTPGDRIEVLPLPLPPICTMASTDASASGNHSLRVYPNPAGDEWNLESEMPVTVYNSSGQRVWESAGGNHLVSSASWPSGLYIVRSEGAVQKLIIH